MKTPATARLPTEALLALQEGDLIGAIKHTRAATGMGLRDAKEAVEQFLLEHPDMQERFRGEAHKRSRPLRALVNLGWILLIMAFIAWLLGR